MEVRAAATARDAARDAAGFVGQRASEAVAARGAFALALSGGRTPWIMLDELARMPLPWERCRLFQVDERVAPPGDEARNFTHIESHLLRAVPIPPEAVHPMPVEAPDLESAAAEYAATLAAVCGAPAVLDLAVLGLGADGHTASLLPGDPALERHATDVAVTRIYRGARRMTLTLPALNRARHRLWLVTGREKADALARLLDGDAAIPAGRIERARATVFADGPARGIDLEEGTNHE